jgi:plasmid stabilization system protein ParE
VTYRAIYLPGYREDLKSAYLWYEEQQPGLGRRFREVSRVTIRRIKENPFLFQGYAEDVRRAHLFGFPYGIFYRIKEDVVVIVALQHLHRDPEYIASRLRRN